MQFLSSRSFAVIVLLVAGEAVAAEGDAEQPVQFNRDVRPILAEHCWQCHGPDEQAREAGLRLDIRASAVAAATNVAHGPSDSDSGRHAIVAGSPARSEVIRRIAARDDDRMPPGDFGKPLSAAQIETLTRWVAQGAPYETHWSFQPIQRPAVPDAVAASRARSAIDTFVEARLRRHNLPLAAAADREILLRRVTLALTGLPPTLADLDANETYEQAVDRLLASPHFGEHLAVGWLDAARYADTNGYFGDKPRTMWPWRDWVIRAFNRSQPFDQFTVEQLAGDMLPDATMQQRVATGFNRNHMANNETGIIDEEFRTAYVVDRVDTTMTTWMGLTVGCSQCHDHKFDPITQREFYQLFAYFNNVDEKGLITSDNPPPRMVVATPVQQKRLARLKAEAAIASKKFDSLRPELDRQLGDWEATARDSLPKPPVRDLIFEERFDADFSSATSYHGQRSLSPGVTGTAAKFDGTQHAEARLPQFSADDPWTIAFWLKPDGTLSCVLSKATGDANRRGLEVLLQKARITLHLIERWGVRAVEVTASPSLQSRQWHHVVISHNGSRTADGIRIWIDGSLAPLTVKRDTLGGGSVNNDEPLRIGRRDAGLGYFGLLDNLRIFSRLMDSPQVASWYRGVRLRQIFASPAAKRASRDRDFLQRDFIAREAGQDLRQAWKNNLQARQRLTDFQSTIPTTLVMEELSKPRETRILLRGQYDQPGELVAPGVPKVFSANRAQAGPLSNRLEFARWLVDRDNPLTARVAVNRLWERCFGDGLVRTMNDFGTQGERPTHPELLDWLAVDLVENDWDLKAVLRKIVLSQTFRQNAVQRGAAGWDPENRLWSRGPSYRLSAEVIRDQALAAAGLLQTQVGGPSVKPYQPAGLWKAVSYNGEEVYEPARDAGLWRRGLYTYIKRQAPPPTLLAFDATTRESCVVQRSRTSTPLQALILLNDTTYVEAARVLAARCLSEDGEAGARMERLFRRVLARSPQPLEKQALWRLLERQRMRFEAEPSAARELIRVGESNQGRDFDEIELAAWTVVSQTVLNLDEAIRQP